MFPPGPLTRLLAAVQVNEGIVVATGLGGRSRDGATIPVAVKVRYDVARFA